MGKQTYVTETIKASEMYEMYVNVFKNIQHIYKYNVGLQPVVAQACLSHTRPEIQLLILPLQNIYTYRTDEMAHG